MASISVAMAVYNGETYLPEQLDSILSQLEPQDEIVISYDKSKDGTWQLIQSYSEKYPQVRVLENAHPGINGNFNNAIAGCTGDYIFICDQDDRWAENKRSAVLETFEKTGADMVIHNGVHINTQGEIISDPIFTLYRIGDLLCRYRVAVAFNHFVESHLRSENYVSPIHCKFPNLRVFQPGIHEYNRGVTDAVCLFNKVEQYRAVLPTRKTNVNLTTPVVVPVTNPTLGHNDFGFQR